ncbi:hypothetical protein GCM10025865_04360 [Paraoerskovia sediminicola]|uniref:DUF4031 domain-containing protein n=1 Tax=Paraoerskovia sediminicola TaxID=1138587 RepID=A0ABN6X8M6_9CELL|nr:DUF4031 domain-containing protein [Paraoerskovia sediminicola]BDZ41137.1 hypothetical protein GCM10025865_04360 [Paraoerskovia sediminicola]
MTVLVDPPSWPAHGTLWSHLVSDTSLDELHRFAGAVGIARRAFDLDHYDVPASRYDELVASGAVPVGGRDLARRLVASGLRVPGRDRRAAKDAALLGRWSAVWASEHPAPLELGRSLLDRWHEPHRTYHDAAHLTFVLDSLDQLLAESPGTAGPPRTLHLALWFHDAVHDGVAGDDEKRSAALAVESLTPLLEPIDVAEVARLVRLTATHDPDAADLAGALVCDADLAILGTSSDRYARYARQVRAKYAHVPDDVFASARAEVLETLLTRPALYRTDQGRRAWEARARANVGAEIAALRR